MKVSIDVSHGWSGAMAKCLFCGYEFMLIRKRSQKVLECNCLCCGNKYTIQEQETPWVGQIEWVEK